MVLFLWQATGETCGGCLATPSPTIAVRFAVRRLRRRVLHQASFGRTKDRRTTLLAARVEASVMQGLAAFFKPLTNDRSLAHSGSRRWHRCVWQFGGKQHH
jgi:hypothetical protein